MIKWDSYLQNGERVHAPARSSQTQTKTQKQEQRQVEKEEAPRGGSAVPEAQAVRGTTEAGSDSGAPPAHQMIELARQLLGPRYPGPNKITQQGPPFLPYDPWSRHRRHEQQAQEQQLEQMTRIARERARDDAAAGPPGFPDEED